MNTTSMPIVNVYIAAIPEKTDDTPLYPHTRQAEIDAIKNIRVQNEKRCVWQLLAYALEHSFGFKMNEMEFTKSKNGRWSTTVCDFSLSHTYGIVAVAVSNGSVGIDIEGYRPNVNDRFAAKILNDAELTLFNKTDETERYSFLLRSWVMKESLFKYKSNKNGFIPTEYDTLSGKAYTQMIKVGDAEYFLSVASDTPDAIHIYTDIDLLAVSKK